MSANTEILKWLEETIEIERDQFHARLERALAQEATFHALPANVGPQAVLDIVQGHAS